jgi:hypothetical protein
VVLGLRVLNTVCYLCSVSIYLESGRGPVSLKILGSLALESRQYFGFYFGNVTFVTNDGAVIDFNTQNRSNVTT